MPRPQSHLKSGSLMSLSWTSDGTQLAASGGNGATLFGQVVDVALEDGRVRVNLEDDHKVGQSGAWSVGVGFTLANP